MISFLSILRVIWPYLLCFCIGSAGGFNVAWYIQGLRVTSTQQEFSVYKTKQAETLAKQEAISKAQQDKDGYEYEELKAVLQKEQNSNSVWKRCIAAGKCGTLTGVLPRSCSTEGTIQTTAVSDGPVSDSVPIVGGTTEKESEAPPLINECAITTLMLNQLQKSIESQEGY